MVVLADTINNVTMKIYVNEDGSAEFTETWNVLANSGSEWYKQLYNLGNMEITNFKDSFELLSIITDYLLTFPKVFKYTLG